MVCKFRKNPLLNHYNYFGLFDLFIIFWHFHLMIETSAKKYYDEPMKQMICRRKWMEPAASHSAKGNCPFPTMIHSNWLIYSPQPPKIVEWLELWIVGWPIHGPAPLDPCIGPLQSFGHGKLWHFWPMPVWHELARNSECAPNCLVLVTKNAIYNLGYGNGIDVRIRSREQ